MLSTVLHDQTIRCKDSEFQVFREYIFSNAVLTFLAPPAGQSCAAYAGQFAQAVGGYLNNPDATDNCQFCQASVGDSFLVTLNIDYSTRWRDFGIFVSLLRSRNCPRD